MTVWGLTDGSAGMVAQVKALAFAMNKPVEMKTVSIKKPFVLLPNAVHGALFKSFVFPGFVAGDALIAPWPELVISCGRRAGLVAMGLRQKLLKQHQRPLFIHIQDPQMSPKLFDVVVAMAHDKVQGENVLKAKYALHRITPDVLAQAKAQWEKRFSAYPKQHVAVLLGGSTNKYTLTEAGMGEVIAQLQAVLAASAGSLLITPSRRTGDVNVARLREAFAGNARVYIYDFVEENPYMGILAVADTLVVTDDSVNMMSEAHATGKPIYLIKLPGHAGTKPARFGAMLEQEGAARVLTPMLEKWGYTKSQEMEWLANKVKNRLLNAVW
ncbi:MAG: mitochondrial fission ELM1 family protein [Rickettsiales bacterium]|nr:mitochondrial fission ELM1 family protein [Rickettsiales bacterium]